MAEHLADHEIKQTTVRVREFAWPSVLSCDPEQTRARLVTKGKTHLQSVVLGDRVSGLPIPSSSE